LPTQDGFEMRAPSSLNKSRVNARIGTGLAPTWIAVLAGAMLLLPCGRAAADKISLTLGTSIIQFQDANPDTTPSVQAVSPVPVTVNFDGNGTWVLQILANGDLVSGANTIPINRISWTASGVTFMNGTLSKSTAQTVATGNKQTSDASGTLRFFLQNSWNYATGSYGQSLTFTAVTF
jgi:hypothetical protein